jgi:diguanylate cyclase (GGDEF)-like protein/PAS domain S-box-containing protein
MPGIETDSECSAPPDATAAFESTLRQPESETYLLRLYVGGMTPNSLRAIENIRSICADHLPGRHQLEIIDIYQQPLLAKKAQIVAAPTLIKEAPLPYCQFIGDLSLKERILFGMGIRSELPDTPQAREAEKENLRQRLKGTEEVLPANGDLSEVDVYLVPGSSGDQVFTVNGAEQPYRILVETMNEGAVILAADGAILYANSRLATMLQVPLERLIGAQIGSFVAPAHQASFQAQLELPAQKCVSLELDLISGAGTLVPALISRTAHVASCVSRAAGLVITDLTQQKHNVEEIIAAEKLARSIIEQAGEAIVVCNEDGRIIRASRLAHQLCGASPLSQPFNELFHLRMRQSEDLFSIFTTLQGTLIESAEVELEQSDRQLFHLILNATPLKSVQDRIVGCVVTLTDFTQRKRAEEELRQERDLAQSYLDTAETIIVVIDLDGRISTINRKGCQVLGWKEADLLGQLWSSAAQRNPDLAGEEDAQLSRLLAGDAESGAAYHEAHLVTRNGELRQIAWHDAVLRDEQGTLTGVLKCGEDITDRKEADEKLQLFARVFEQSGEAIIITGPGSEILAVNSTFTRLTGYSQDDALGQNPRILQSGKESCEFYRSMWEILSRENYWQGELWNKRKDGSLYPKWLAISVVRNDQGEVINYIGSFTDISERKQAASRIERLAHYDPLTNLPNRYNLLGKLTQALELAKRSVTNLSLLFIDLDHFKNINDSLGHHIGDILLNQVAERLLESVRSADIVARLGGDEFVVVLQQIHSGIDAALIATKIQQSLSQTFQLEGHSLHVTPSIGISVFPYDGENVDDLMKNADLAMYHAKGKGRNNYQFYKTEMNEDVHERLLLESDLLAAIGREEFILHYQPQIDLATGRAIGVEALVRWQHPVRGMVMPDIFIPLAEETGLILPIGDWVLKSACRQMAAWSLEGLPPFRMAVNLSARQFKKGNLPGMLEDLILATGIDPHLLELEITESVAMDNPERAIYHLRRFREMGIELAIDDFGTGYSSLSYLKLFPVNRLKIDSSFIQSIETGSEDSAIAAATIALAHTLGKAVVAEGVETEGQLSFLRAQNCDIVQGYLFSVPLPARELVDFVRRCGR